MIAREVVAQKVDRVAFNCFISTDLVDAAMLLALADEVIE
jgi:hypothetical protein